MNRWIAESRIVGDFSMEYTPVLSFPSKKGRWLGEVARNLILGNSSKGDLVLDMFVGGNAMVVLANLLGRRSVGVGDVEGLSGMESDSVDLILTYLSYADANGRSVGIFEDLSPPNVEDFIADMHLYAKESRRVLRANRCCAVLIRDKRQKRSMVSLGKKLMEVFLDDSWLLEGIVIKGEQSYRETYFYPNSAILVNLFLTSDGYGLVFRKPQERRLEAGRRKLEIGRWKTEVGCWK